MAAGVRLRNDDNSIIPHRKFEALRSTSSVVLVTVSAASKAHELH